MKKIAVLFVLILAFCGCENSSGPGLPKENLEERFSCKADGKLFVARPDSREMWGRKGLRIEYHNAGDTPSYLLTIGASGFDTSNVVGMNFSCKNVLKTDTTYALTFGNLVFRSGAAFEPIKEGTLRLSQFGGGKIAGTFQLTIKERGGTEVVTVTNGKFNATYESR